ncbi:hypothetical protein HDU81_009518 [Chytriomyces hyalinus]|nr:hypothetical protein HDU81_009518 [Chytriomyces hyalinus]
MQQSTYVYPAPASTSRPSFPNTNLIKSQYEYPPSEPSFSPHDQHGFLDSSMQRKRPMRQRRASSAPAPDMSLILQAASLITEEENSYSSAENAASCIEPVEEAAKRRKMSVLEALRMLSEPTPMQQQLQPHSPAYFDSSYLHLSSAVSSTAVSPLGTGLVDTASTSEPNLACLSKASLELGRLPGSEGKKSSLAIITDTLFISPGAPASARCVGGNLLVGGRKMSLSNLVSRRESIYGLNAAMFVASPTFERSLAAVSIVKEEDGAEIETIKLQA